MSSQEETRQPATGGSDRSDGSEPRENDVVCEKGRGDHERWPGNKLYRHLVKVNKESYNDRTPMERSEVIGKIIGTVREKNGWFVQLDEESGNWVDLNEEKVRKKVSDDLRREVRRRRERRSNNTVFSAKLRALKEMEDREPARDILEPVEDPRQTDVLFGAGARRHPGNKTYWRLMKLNLDHYIISPYGARSMISRSIVQGIRDQNGRFLEQDPKTAVWYEISDRRAIEKTSHALSNKKYKTRKRVPDSPGGQLSASGEAQDDNDTWDTPDDESPGPPSPTDESPTSKPRSKKHRLLHRMTEPPLIGVPTVSGIKKVTPSASPAVPESPPRVVSISDKSGSLESPPYDPKTNPETRYPMGEPPVVSPNDSRASPSSSDQSYEEAQHASAFGRYYRREPKMSPPEMRRYVHSMPEAEVDPRYEAYHPDDRHCREGPVYPPRGVRPREHSYAHYVERESSWHPSVGEAMEYYPPSSMRHPPVYSVVSPRGRGTGPPLAWAHRSEWEVPPSARRHPDDGMY
jgi:hypothetical protein